MKAFLLTAIVAGFSLCVTAQETLAPDQNSQYAISRSKYMAMADSINQLHSTTVHQTYKAFDWYEDKMERRKERIQFRRDLRMTRAQRNYYNPYRSYYRDDFRNRRYQRDPFYFWWF